MNNTAKKGVQANEPPVPYKESYADLGYIYLKAELELEIYTFMDTHILNKDSIHELLSDKTSNSHFNEIHVKVMEINTEYTHSFHNTDTETSTKLKELLAANKNDIHYIFTYYEFNWFISNLKKYGKDTLATKDEEKIIQNYIEFYINNPESNGYHAHNMKSYLENLLSNYNWASDYKEKYLISNAKTNSMMLPDIILSIRNQKMYADDTKRHLDLFSVNDFKKSILQGTPEYIDHLVHVCSWSLAGNDFEPIKSKISQALVEISKENNAFKRKAEDIAKYAELNLEDKK